MTSSNLAIVFTPSLIVPKVMSVENLANQTLVQLVVTFIEAGSILLSWNPPFSPFHYCNIKPTTCCYYNNFVASLSLFILCLIYNTKSLSSIFSLSVYGWLCILDIDRRVFSGPIETEVANQQEKDQRYEGGQQRCSSKNPCKVGTPYPSRTVVQSGGTRKGIAIQKLAICCRSVRTIACILQIKCEMLCRVNGVIPFSSLMKRKGY